MLPFERQLYVVLLQKWISEENDRIRKENQKMKG